MNPSQQYVTDKQLAIRYGVARVTVWRWVREDNFPSPIKLGGNCTRWRLADVEQWEKTKTAA